MTPRPLDEDFELVLPQIRALKMPVSAAHRRYLVGSAIRAAAPQVMLKSTSFSSSAAKLAMHLDYISRNGDNEVFDRDGNRLSQSTGGDEHPREAIQLYGQELARENQTRGEKMGRRRSRVSMNMMLSMPAGTDKTAFELAVGEFLTREYEHFDYLYTFHDDRDHYHAHVVVGLKGRDGSWLNPRKNDLLQWRQSFADSLQRRGIAAKATPSYTQGRRKSSYRRDHAELEKRGKRRVPRPSPTYDPAKEDGAISERRAAWARIAAHYQEKGEENLAEGIARFVARQFDGRVLEGHAPEPRGRGGRGR